MAHRWPIATTVALGAVSTALYAWNVDWLNGQWILDDKGTITMNPVVQGSEPWKHVWTKDFWGHDDLSSVDSHKSWRPLCTAIYRLNHWAAGGTEPFWYHVVDRVLHGLVTALVFWVALRTSRAVTRERRAGFALMCALLFAAHPIHCEAVANTTGRAEVLCALFYMLGFLVYSAGDRHASHATSAVRCGVVLVCTLCSMLCKEHGITLPIVCVIWDAYLGTTTSVPEALSTLVHTAVPPQRKEKGADTSTTPKKPAPKNEGAKEGAKQHHPGAVRANGSGRLTGEMPARDAGPLDKRLGVCQKFLLRVGICAVGTALLITWRLRMNGPAGPDFACEQNPAACHDSRFVRFLSFSWLWCFNFVLLAYPAWLSPDWSGPSIPLVESFADYRLPALLLLYAVMAFAMFKMVMLAALPVPGDRTEFLTCDIPGALVGGGGKAPKSQAQAQAQAQARGVGGKNGGGGASPSAAPQSTATAQRRSMAQREVMVAFLWMLVTFLLSSNLLQYVGFVVADRTLYLPSFGFCLLVTHLLAYVGDQLHEFTSGGSMATASGSGGRSITWALVAVVVAVYVAKQQSQTRNWSDPVLVWGEGFRVNPGSCITGTEFGMSLTNAQRPVDAAKVLWSSHKRELKEGWFTSSIKDRPGADDKKSQWMRLSNIMQTRFKLVTSLGNAGFCDQSRQLSTEALEIIGAERPKVELALQSDTSGTKTLRGLSHSMGDNTAYFHIALSRCARTAEEMNYHALKAYETRPQMPYTVNFVQSVMKMMEDVNRAGVNPAQVYIKYDPTNDPDNQVADREFMVAHTPQQQQMLQQQQQQQQPGW